MTMADLLKREEQPLWCKYNHSDKCDVPDNHRDSISSAIKEGNFVQENIARILYQVQCKENQSFCQINKRLGGNQ